MSEHLEVLDEQKEALRQIELILPQLSEDIFDVIEVMENQLLPAVLILEETCSTETTQQLKETVQNELSATVQQLLDSSGFVSSLGKTISELKQQLTGLSLISEEEE